ncbi:MAG TPA: NUDIX hydrolase, partial [Cryptosporangiaceae bacterium]|nr:NUDIX hydrolase [Cryptosporangiaceae bacterium]
MSGTANDLVRAAGGVLWRPVTDAADDHGIEVAVIHRPRYDDWSLPKGKLDAGEHPIAAAGREVVEETGIQPILGARLPSTSYQTYAPAGPVRKTVDYWAMRCRDDQPAPRPFVPNREVDRLDWLPPRDAMERLTQPHDAAVVEALVAMPRITGTV